MPLRGCGGVIRADGDVIGEVRDWSVSESGQEQDASTLGNCNTKSDITSVTTTLSVSAFLAPTDAAQVKMKVGARVALELYPIDATTAGVLYWTSADTVVLGREFSGNHSDFLPVSWSMKANDGLTPTTV